MPRALDALVILHGGAGMQYTAADDLPVIWVSLLQGSR